MTETLSCASEFEFNMPEQNQMYDALEERVSTVQILRNGDEIFFGEVREISEETDKIKSVYCVGELAFLFDSIQPQARYQGYTPAQLFVEMLNIHNAKVEGKKRFKVGIVTVTDPNNSLYRFTNGEDTLTAIREKLCKPLNGYLRIRKVDGERYLDLVRLEDYGVSAEQPIQFGRNLLKYTSKKNGASIATVCFPRGAKLDTQVVEGLDAYTDIKSVNDGKYYVVNEEAFKNYGWIERVVNWNDVTVPANLKTKAEEWVNNNQYKTLSLELRAVDLAELNANIEPYNVGDMILAIAEPFGMNTWFPLMKKVTYLNDSITNDVTLSYETKISYTQQQNNKYQKIENALPQETELLARAKKNASQLIANASEGNVFFVYDDDGKPKEMLIIDTNDINTAQKVWRWNINGLGYSSTGYDGEYGLAMTMDGAIVADFITAGTMYADRIKGGTLTLGHANNDNGRIEIFNSEGKMIGEWDCDGFRAQTDSYATTEYLPKYFENNFYNYPYYDETQGTFDIPVGDYVASYIIELEDATSEHTVYVKFKNPNVDTVYSISNTGYSTDVDTIYKFTATNGRLILTVSNWFANASYSDHITGDMGYVQVSVLYGDVEKIWSPTTGIKRVSVSTGGGGSGATTAVKYSYDNNAVKMCAAGMNIDTENGEIESDHYSISEKGFDIRLNIGEIGLDTTENSRINKLNLGKNGMSMSAFEFDNNNNMSEYKYMELLTSLYEAGFKFVSPHIAGAPEAYFGIAGIKNTAVNNTTTSGGANVRVTADGDLYKYASSSKRYKKDVAAEICEELNPEKLYDLTVVQYKYNDGYLKEKDERCGKYFIGFIAEEVAEKYPLACNVDGEGRPEMWEIGILFPALLKLVQEQKKLIDNLTERVDKLGERLGDTNG